MKVEMEFILLRGVHSQLNFSVIDSREGQVVMAIVPQ